MFYNSCHFNLHGSKKSKFLWFQSALLSLRLESIDSSSWEWLDHCRCILVQIFGSNILNKLELFHVIHIILNLTYKIAQFTNKYQIEFIMQSKIFFLMIFVTTDCQKSNRYKHSSFNKIQNQLVQKDFNRNKNILAGYIIQSKGEWNVRFGYINSVKLLKFFWRHCTWRNGNRTGRLYRKDSRWALFDKTEMQMWIWNM